MDSKRHARRRKGPKGFVVPFLGGISIGGILGAAGGYAAYYSISRLFPDLRPTLQNQLAYVFQLVLIGSGGVLASEVVARWGASRLVRFSTYFLAGVLVATLQLFTGVATLSMLRSVLAGGLAGAIGGAIVGEIFVTPVTNLKTPARIPPTPPEA